MRFEIRDLGVEHEQYFQGVGVAFTDWDAVYVGNGPTLREAIEDALEGAAQSDVDTSGMEPTDFTSEDLDRELPAGYADEVHVYAALFVAEVTR